MISECIHEGYHEMLDSGDYCSHEAKLMTQSLGLMSNDSISPDEHTSSSKSKRSKVVDASSIELPRA